MCICVCQCCLSVYKEGSASVVLFMLVYTPTPKPNIELYRTLFIASTSFSFQQISGNCNTTILHTPEGFSYLYSYDCTLVPGNIYRCISISINL